MVAESEVYARIGDDGFTRLVAAFYRRVRADDLIGPLYPPDDWDNAEWRLRQFLIWRFNGPQTYIETRGHPRLRMRHSPFPIGPPAAERWLILMRGAMAETELPIEVVPVLWAYFVQTAGAMVNHG